MKLECPNEERSIGYSFSSFGFRHSFVIRHSSFLNPTCGRKRQSTRLRSATARQAMTLTRPRGRMSQMKPIMFTGECNTVQDDLRCSHKRHDSCQDKERQSPRTKAATKALKPVNIKEGKGD